MTHEDIVDAILDGAIDGYEDIIYSAIKRRREISNTKKIVKIRVGDRVKFNGLANPKYLIDVEGEVTKINKTKIVVRIDDNFKARKYRGLETTTPVSIVDVV